MLLRSLLAHYRRHPVQAGFLLVSIIMANVLLVGTQLINAQSRASYAQGEQVLRSVPMGEIRARDASLRLQEKDYIVLRRQGFDMLAPVLRQTVRTEGSEPLELLGIDPLAMPRLSAGSDAALEGARGFSGFSLPPYEIWASATRMEQLGWKEGDAIRTLDGRLLPPAHAVAGGELGHRLLLDIGALQALTNTAGQLSYVMVFDAPAPRLAALRAALPPQLEYVAGDQSPDPAELTRSFHLNLAAMGLLAFVVGIFLTYNALAFSYTDRHDLIRKLRLAGATRGELRRALLVELALFLSLGSVLGWWLGAQLAALLLPGVGQTLAQLYGVYIAYPDVLAPGGIWMPLLMTAASAMLCVAWPMRQSLRAPLLERWTAGWQIREVARRDAALLVGGIALLALAWLLGSIATVLWVALAGMACLLLGAALCLPFVLRLLLAGLARLVPATRPRLAWLLADSRWLLGPAALALMAMTLALVANSGLNTMIFSFRQATDDWLQQRLAAQLYFRADLEQSEVISWLEQEAPGAKLVERYRNYSGQSTPDGRDVRVEIVTLQDDERFRGTVGLLETLPDAQQRFEKAAGVLISERAWRLDGWQVGDQVELCPGLSVPVLGVYYDYGNPLSQWMTSEVLFNACWPRLEPASLAIIGPDSIDWGGIRERLSRDFALEQDEVISQAELKGVGLAVFDRTFRVTNALNGLTLLVAGIGIFCAISAIHHHRVVQQALLAALGLTRRERGALLLLQWGLLGLLCMLLVWPFGTLLAGFLARVVTPVAFGWSFALQLEWQHYAVLALVAAACLVLAVVLPSLRLLTTSPATMLREETL